MPTAIIYRIKPGCSVYLMGEEREAQAGELVHLTEAQAESWADEVEPAGVSDKVLPPKPQSGLDSLGLESGVVQKLTEAGFGSIEALQEADDKALEAIKGIGPATVQEIRDRLP